MDESGWLIEHAESESYAPRYFTGRLIPALQWSDPGDHADACRFSRFEDAKRMAVSLGAESKHRVCEHGWDSGD